MQTTSRLGLCHQGQRLVQLALGHRRQSHQVEAGLVALVVGVLDHVEGQRDLVDVGGDPDEVEHALRLRQDVLGVVALVGVGHRRQLQGRVVVADDAPDVALDTVLPRSELPGRELRAGVDVPDLHVVDAALDAGLIDRLDGLVRELVVVHQAAVPDGAVHHLDLGAVRNPMARRTVLRRSLTHRTVSFVASSDLRYCIGEKSVASMNTESTEAASRPSRLSSSNAVLHSGSVRKASQLCCAASRLSCCRM